MGFAAGAWNAYAADGNLSSHYTANVSNCTETEISPSCERVECNDEGCLLKCPESNNVCYVQTCWSKDWGLITATQICIFILFVLGIVSVIVMYFRVCNRAVRRDYASYPSVREAERNEEYPEPGRAQISIIENRGRPPSYSEACSAPPLYSSPYNRVSMLEPPPVYPETPKLSDRDLRPAHPAAVHHI